MSNASTPDDPFFRDPSTPPRLFERYDRTPPTAPQPYPGPYETQGHFVSPRPHRSRSRSAVAGVPDAPRVEPPGACMSCHKSIDPPCAIYILHPCPKCYERTRDCWVCGGSGAAVPDTDQDPADCNPCVGSGKMATCTFCDGSLRIRCSWCLGRGGGCTNCSDTRWVDCTQCDGQGRRRCPDCDSTGWIATFDHFCVGDAERWPAAPGYEPRRHFQARDFDRTDWSRIELVNPTSGMTNQ